MAKFSQTATKVSQMMEIAFDFSSTLEKRENATTNILVLAKENAGIILHFSTCSIVIKFIILNVSFVERWGVVGKGRNI